jgi:DNA-binding CsgD family transcriptional regulator/tetratricopeptide (TPR) repeat protein
VLLVTDRVTATAGLTSMRGRDTECTLLDEMIASVRAGQSRTLVVRGEAGVGKTALLEYAVRSASGLQVSRAVGVESEIELPFAALHQVCAPILDHLERLPSPQRDALRIVFGMSGGPAPDGFLVGLAVLTLLSDVAEEHPLLCVVDDAQWLDHASARTLAFVARRLFAEAVGILFAAREPGEELRGLPELEVRGLGNGDARSLLSSAVRFRLDERVRDLIVAETRGNPLALLELPRGLTAAQLAGGFGLVGAAALSGRIEESFLRRLQALPEETQRLLLVASAETTGDPLLVWRASERLGIAASAAAAAEADGLITIGQRVTFRHPLVRSGVYRSASPPERRAVHRALAEVTDPNLDPDRRAWHLAVAAPGPDEDVALELERSAGRAQARGGLAAAGAFLQRSVALTRDPARRADRALAAALANLHAGAFDAALELLATAEAGALDDFQRARADLLRGQIALISSAGREAPGLLLKAAKRFEPLDVTLARETYLDAWGAAMFAGSLARDGTLLDVSRAAEAAPRPQHSAGPSDLLLDGLAMAITNGLAAAAPTLRAAVDAFCNQAISVEKGLQWAVLASTAAALLWDFDSWRTIITGQADLARAAGAYAPLSIALHGQGIVVTWCGNFDKAATPMAEAAAVTEATGTRIAPYGAVLLAAFRGREAEAASMIKATIENAIAGGEGLAVQYAFWGSAILHNGLGRYDEALTAARQASDDTPELFIAAWALPELIEAATRIGNAELASTALVRLTEAASVSDSDWGLGVEARSRALLSEGELADALYREAIERLRRTRVRPELARAHLLYGEWLRRGGRRSAAREQLRTAHHMLTAIGMEAFAERARRELMATGEKVRKRTVETRDQLTAQEEQIARLARDGLSNPEIGARLYISPRTVEWHLHKVFTKLGVSSRKGLESALPHLDRRTVVA